MTKYINDMYLENGADRSADIFTNIHYQDNPHINFTLPYLDSEGKTVRFVKSRTYFFKKIAKHFTKVVDNTLGTNIKDYKTESELALIDILKDFMTSLIEYTKEEQKVIVEHFGVMEKEGNVEAIKRLIGDMKGKVTLEEIMNDYKKGKIGGGIDKDKKKGNPIK